MGLCRQVTESETERYAGEWGVGLCRQVAELETALYPGGSLSAGDGAGNESVRCVIGAVQTTVNVRAPGGQGAGDPEDAEDPGHEVHHARLQALRPAAVQR